MNSATKIMKKSYEELILVLVMGTFLIIFTANFFFINATTQYYSFLVDRINNSQKKVSLTKLKGNTYKNIQKLHKLLNL